MSIQQFTSQAATPQDPALLACLQLRDRSVADLTRHCAIDWDPWSHGGDRENEPMPPDAAPDTDPAELS